MKVHIHINTRDGLGTDTKGLTIHELSPDEVKEHYYEFNRRHRAEYSDGHTFLRRAILEIRALHKTNGHVARHNGEIVGAISHGLGVADNGQKERYISSLGSIHPGAGHALLRHVADISEREGSHLQGAPATERVHRLYSTLARRDGGELERIGDGSGYRLKRPKP